MSKDILKPITLVRADFISSLSNLINNSGLPMFVIEPILKDMYNDVKILSRKQLEIDTKRYEEQLNKKGNE